MPMFECSYCMQCQTQALLTLKLTVIQECSTTAPHSPKTLLSILTSIDSFEDAIGLLVLSDLIHRYSIRGIGLNARGVEVRSQWQRESRPRH